MFVCPHIKLLPLAELLCVFRSGKEEAEVERTSFTVRDPSDDSVTLARERPALLISSTSWTGWRNN